MRAFLKDQIRGGSRALVVLLKVSYPHLNHKLSKEFWSMYQRRPPWLMPDARKAPNIDVVIDM